ncbi:Response regulator receiver domain containing protein [Trichomonas vaginalis G3]|uniref:Response regulator receiver domain containing protein n=1 Tax=Trichomonas vaginalis (strain ATCC PRA-98 / G3) TaxID=412133 RepID=A2FE42_TRIV3|nr:phosphorelay sensor kinase protein [Trichomonas vaginalis G3]EAX96814.1 Response regulator receiver domain containing protein [Trichomonas vaginalis G3]KAI5536689.1 phosphorelay sensor kinase protein [Trichomonas vaginalis G3]|eukprot:XP_001309744.1 Response regulator receiver domain containing protein [Trichomonas vaginalis G3]
MLIFLLQFFYIEQIPFVSKLLNKYTVLTTEFNITSLNGTYYSQCQIQRSVGSIYAIKNEENHLFDVSIDPNVIDSRHFFHLLRSKNISCTISKNKIGKYHIIQNEQPNSINIENTELKFIKNPFSVNVMTVGFYPHDICPSVTPFTYSTGLFYLATAILFIIVAIYIQSFKNVSSDHPRWFISNDEKINYKFYEEGDNIETFFLTRSLFMSRQTGLKDSAVGRLFRGEQSQTFERIATIPINDKYRLQLYWLETPDPPSTPNLEVKFTSDELQIHGKPQISFSSFRSFRPITLDFTLSYNVRGKIEIPSEFIAPFQPFGQLVTNANHILKKVSEIFKNTAFLRSKFSDIMVELCKILNCKAIYAVNQDNLIITNYSQNPSDLLSDSEIYEMVGKIPSDSPIHYYTRDLLPGHDFCYVSHYNDNFYKLDCVLVFNSEPVNKLFKELGVRILMESCLFVHRFIITKEHSLRFQHIIDLLTNSKSFVFAELLDDGTPILYKTSFKQNSFTSLPILPSRDIIHDDIELKQYTELLDKVKKDNSFIRKFSYHVVETNNGSEIPRCLAVSAVCNYDTVIGSQITTIYAEEISTIKQQKSDLISALNDLSIANKVLGLYKFNIEGNNLVLTDNRMLIDIRFDSNQSLTLNSIIHPDDLLQIEDLLDGQKVIFRIQTPTSLIWYSAISNKISGFLFCVNYLLDEKGVQSNKDLECEIPELQLWGVDIRTMKVFKLYDLPTIWDILCIPKETEFTYFINFIHEENRSAYAYQYQRILQGSKQNITEEYMFNRCNCEFDWVRLTMFRKEENIICIMTNINSIKDSENKDMESFAERNSFFLNARMMPWVFENRMDELQNRLTSFEPGISKLLTMNWWFIDHFVENKEEVCAVIENMHEKIGKFHMVCRLNFENSVSILINGEHKRNGTTLTGFCIEINSIFKSWSDLVRKYDSLRVSHQKNESDDKNSKHEILSIFNDIFCSVDLMSLDKSNNNEFYILDSFQFVLSHLLDIYNNQTEDIKYQTDKSTSELDLLDIFERLLIPIDKVFIKHGIELDVTVENIFPSLCIINSVVVSSSFILVLIYAANNCKDKICHVKLSFSEPNATVRIIYHGDVYPTVKLVNPLHVEYTINKQKEVEITVILPAKTVSLYSSLDNNIQSVIAVENQTLSNQLRMYLHNINVITTDLDHIDSHVSYLFYDYENESKVYEKLSKNNQIKLCHISRTFKDDHCVHGPLICSQVMRFLNQNINIRIPNDKTQFESLHKHILVVEDNKTNQIVLLKILDFLGCSHQVANTGEEALRLLEDNNENVTSDFSKTNFDIIIMDMRLPVLDGIQTSRIIRKSNKWYSNIYIIGISAALSSKSDCLNSGMNIFVPKPIRIETLRNAISQSF